MHLVKDMPTILVSIFSGHVSLIQVQSFLQKNMVDETNGNGGVV